ncbi:MAG: FAD-dependent oxidoreductase [Pseudomonadota bacterium]
MKTLIIGGGLSGLALAERLEDLGQDYELLESRDRFGGRIMTERHGAGFFDMGPAWFWPGQPRIEALIRHLGLQKFSQYSDGALSYEDETGRVRRNRGFASMQGSWRLDGGLSRLTEALHDRLPKARTRLNAQVTGLEQIDDGIRVTLLDGSHISAERIVLAIPPRITAQLSFAPALPAPALHALNTIATWMAGQAKAVAVYEEAFWRQDGLSGDAMSRIGPLVELHDASPMVGGPYALFGFVGVPPIARNDEQALLKAIKAQLERIFGPKAAAPSALFLKDWSRDTFTATQADAAPQYSHPVYGMPVALNDLWDGRLILAGTEVAREFGGFLEGALESAEAALDRLTPKERAYR